jgi:hypothetical protein
MSLREKVLTAYEGFRKNISSDGGVFQAVFEEVQKEIETKGVIYGETVDKWIELKSQRCAKNLPPELILMGVVEASSIAEQAFTMAKNGLLRALILMEISHKELEESNHE